MEDVASSSIDKCTCGIERWRKALREQVEKVMLLAPYDSRVINLKVMILDVGIGLPSRFEAGWNCQDSQQTVVG